MDGAELLYPPLLLPELAAKIAKEMGRHGLRKPPQQVSEALTALLLEVDMGLIQPRAEHLETAMTLKALGHLDVFDCILYATALHEETPASNQGQEAAPLPRRERPGHGLRAGTVTD